MKFIFPIILWILTITTIISWYFLSWDYSTYKIQEEEIKKWKEIQETIKNTDFENINNINIEKNTINEIIYSINEIIKTINQNNNDTLIFWNINYWTEYISFEINNIKNYNSIDMFLISIYLDKNYVWIEEFKINQDKDTKMYSIKGKWLLNNIEK